MCITGTHRACTKAGRKEGKRRTMKKKESSCVHCVSGILGNFRVAPYCDCAFSSCFSLQQKGRREEKTSTFSSFLWLASRKTRIDFSFFSLSHPRWIKRDESDGMEVFFFFLKTPFLSLLFCSLCDDDAAAFARKSRVGNIYLSVGKRVSGVDGKLRPRLLRNISGMLVHCVKPTTTHRIG